MKTNTNTSIPLTEITKKLFSYDVVAEGHKVQLLSVNANHAVVCQPNTLTYIVNLSDIFLIHKT